MNLTDRVKNILTSPKTEWAVIEDENVPHVKLFTTYVLPLALIPAIAAFIGYGLTGYSVLGVRVHSVEWGIRQAVSQFVVSSGGVYLTAFIIDFLAEHFGSRKDFNKAFSLVAYAYTPIFAGGIFYILPSLTWLASLAGIYGLYLLYAGLKPMMQTPEEKKTSYFVVSLLSMIVVFVVIGTILSAILLKSYTRGIL
jgi:hypothetical protein